MTKQWRAVPREELEVAGQRVVEDEEGNEVAYVGFDEDADLIALAVNAHAGLVDALKSMLHEFNEQMPGIVHDELAVISKSREALAKAGVK